MTILGIIGCNVLANELAYLIRRDPQILKATVIDTPEGRMMVEKLERTHACQVIELSEGSMLRSRSYRSDEVIIWMNPSDLHDSQAKMKNVLESQMDQMSSTVDGLFMMYGQCRCQTIDRLAIQASLGIPIVFLTDRTDSIVDDCFAAIVGGCKQYLELMRAHKGTLFVTQGYVDQHTAQQRTLDLGSVVEESEQLRDLLELIGYKKVMKLDNQMSGDREYDAMVEMFCRTFDLELMTKACNLAVFEDSYDLAKSSMSLHARMRQLLDDYGVVWA